MFLPLFILAVVASSLAADVAAPVPIDNPREAELISSEEYKGITYQLYGQTTWLLGLEICAANGLRLVRINDQNKNDEVTYFIDKLTAITGPCWTGASRIYDGITWAFGIGNPVKFFNWAAGEPNNRGGNELCIEINKNGQWNDKDCTAQRFVLCESNAN